MRVIRRILTLAFVVAAASLTLVQAQIVRQATELLQTSTTCAALDDAGTAAFAVSTTDPFGTNPDHIPQIFRWDPDTGAGAQITSFADAVIASRFGISVSDNGQQLLFVSYGDLTGQNADQSAELFLMQADGSGLLQLTDQSAGSYGTIYFPALAGSGNRAVFSSNADYLGTNPTGVFQTWVVDSDGTGLRQLTTAQVHGGFWPSISDDGQRIVFATSEDLVGTGNQHDQVFGILTDGTGLSQITALSFGRTEYPMISGDGSTIAFYTTASVPGLPGGCNGDQIAVVDWDGSNLGRVAAPCLGAVVGGYVSPPEITDDGQVVFYAAYGFGLDFQINWEVFRVNKDGSGWMQLTDTDDGPGPGANCSVARVAGAGGRVSFVCADGEPYGGPNPDFSEELFAMSGTGTSHRQLSEGVDGESWDPDLTPDSSRMVYVSDANPLAEPGYWWAQLYHSTLDAPTPTRITSLAGGTPKQPSITDDGATIAFAHDGDPLGTNAYGYYQIFSIAADGTGLTQLTPQLEDLVGHSDEPHISGNGSLIIFQSRANLLGDNISGFSRVYKIAPNGTGLARLSPDDTDDAEHPRVSASGAWVVYTHGGQIRRQEINGAIDAVIASSGNWPDLTPGGDQVVYESSADPLGTNPEGNDELFLWDDATGTTSQLTSTKAAGHNRRPRFSGNGQWVYFHSDAPHFGEAEPGYFQPFRVAGAGGRVQRVGGLAGCLEQLPAPMSVDHAGSHAVFGTTGDCTTQNPDWSREIVTIDRDAPARIRVSPGPAPTTVHWDVESGPVRYDVIRGDVASLAFDGGGGVDLGVVICVEDDSYDPTTAGFEDVDTPAPGQAFFYLYRGTQGVAAGPGSYDTASDGSERLPAAGDCSG